MSGDFSVGSRISGDVIRRDRSLASRSRGRLWYRLVTGLGASCAAVVGMHGSTSFPGRDDGKVTSRRGTTMVGRSCAYHVLAAKQAAGSRHPQSNSKR